MLKILSIIGTRPDAIKLVPVIFELRRRADRFQSRVCATAQQREMLDQTLGTFRLAADIDLDLMHPDQALFELFSRVLEGVSRVLCCERPDMVLVQGDTGTAAAAALAAFYQRVPVAHVEAGLRSFNRHMPEEINRVLTDHVADRLFCPSETAVVNLAAEGVTAGVQLVVLLPAAWLLSKTGDVNMVWWSFVIAELVSVTLSFVFFTRLDKKIIEPMYDNAAAAQ